MRIPTGETDRYVYFVATDSTDGVTRKTGMSSFTVYRSRNGAASAAMTSPTVSETDATNMPGVYALLVDEDTTLTAGNDVEEMCLHISATGMKDVTLSVEIYRPETTEGYTATVDSSGRIDVGSWIGTAVTKSSTQNKPEVTIHSIVDTALQGTGEVGDEFDVV